jgi:hypothetical protein
MVHRELKRLARENIPERFRSLVDIEECLQV